MPPIPKMLLPKWQAQTHRLMLNPKQILRAKYAGKAVLLWLALSPLQRQLLAIFSSGSLECVGNPRRRHRPRRLIASVEHHNDEHPTRIIAAARLVSSTSDRTTFSVL